MSSPLAIAAVTATLRNLLAHGIASVAELAGASVTARPPDRARTATGNQLNLFLYNVMPNAAWRNHDLPTQARNNEPGFPPLALNLSYLLTAYGRDDEAQSSASDMLLGYGLSILHDHAVLGGNEIAASLVGNDLGAQVERVRLTLQPMPLEELSRLWTSLQTQFRVSAAFEVAVVLIESTRARKIALPVLRRGEADTGPSVLGLAMPPFPDIALAAPATALEPGAALVLKGHDLDGASAVLRLEGLQRDVRREVPATTLAPDRIDAAVPADLPAGLYALQARLTRDGQERPSNTVALTVAPAVASGLPASLGVRGGNLTLTMAAPVLASQPVFLLVGGHSVAASPRTRAATGLAFAVPALPVGAHPARVRVDGIDSAIVADPAARPLQFDPRRLITVTA